MRPTYSEMTNAVTIGYLMWLHDKSIEVSKEPEFNSTFRDWLITHYSTWESFFHASEKMRVKGATKLSAFMITNVLRYKAIENGTRFAMTNTFVPDLARLYNRLVHPLFNVSTRKEK